MVLETFISELRREAPARVEFDALPGRSFEGEIARIVPQADVRSRSFPVKVRLQNELLPDGTPLLKSGMFARVSLPAASRQSVLLVPKDALVLGGKETQVYTVTPADPKKPHEGKAEPVAVIIGVAYKGLVEVRGPLKAGQWVVVEGNERLQAGQSVVMMPTKTKNGSKQPGGGAKDAARNEDRQPVATANPAGRAPANGTDKR
jgi:RND family efflux transporter MFP subunit